MIKRFFKAVLENPLNALLPLAVVAIVMDQVGVSPLNNFVLGLSMLAGGLKNGGQRFDRDKASSDTLLLLLAVTALVIPSLFTQVGHGIQDELNVEILSLGVAGLMIIIYALGLLYGFRLDTGPLTRPSAELVVHDRAWPL